MKCQCSICKNKASRRAEAHSPEHGLKNGINPAGKSGRLRVTILYLLFFCLLAAACGNARTSRQPAEPDSAGIQKDITLGEIQDAGLAPDAPGIAAGGETARSAIAPAWMGLARRLANDGIHGSEVDRLLAELEPTPSQSPMGRKIRELYRRKFFPRPKTARGGPRYYKGVVTQANAALCGQFIEENRMAFELAQKRYGVSPDIASALLFVETRLGKVLADVPENAFYTLASMAASDKPEDISQWLPKLPDYQKHLGWIKETMRKRSEWAYKEFKALVEHMLRDRIPPSALPGSIYGAVGLCQFMPSNISTYGADGDGDGRVDLFNAADAIASLANYLAKHGWKQGLNREKRHKLLMTYNHSVTYANTILALGDLVAKEPKILKQVRNGNTKSRP